MKLSELISRAQALLANEGDLEVATVDTGGGEFGYVGLASLATVAGAERYMRTPLGFRFVVVVPASR